MNKISRPDEESVLGGGRKNITPYDMLPYLPDEECFFDCRHWTWGGDIIGCITTMAIKDNIIAEFYED